jgi:RHS repeat-associated protein
MLVVRVADCVVAAVGSVARVVSPGVGWALRRARLGVVLLVAVASLLASAVLVPVERLGAAVAAVPQPPGPVTPTREVVSVSAQGPTTLSGVKLTKDAVWGPKGSPYVIHGQLTVQTGVALTMLPGTVVKFADQSSRMVVEGQLLSLGRPGRRVTFTSLKDDSVGGDTNGDGSATSPARGDWWSVFVYSAPIGARDGEVNPVSVFDYTDFAYGGHASALNCADGSMIDVSTPFGRAVITNSTFRESYRSGIEVGVWSAIQDEPYRGFVGVYGNTFSDSKCGVSMAEGDIAGNHFDASLETALWSLYPGDVDFRHNTTEAKVISAAGNGVRYRFNQLTTIGQFGTASQQTGDYRWNYWGTNPPGANPLSSAPPQFLPDSITRAYHPTYGPVDTGLGALSYAVEDLTVNDAGKALVATRTYSSHPQGAPDDLGRGWRSAFSESLSQDPTGAVTMETGDGGQVPFGTLSGSGNDSGQSDSLGVAAGISSDASGSAVTTSENTTYKFDTSGQLSSMVLDDPGHEVDFDRAGGKVVKATGVSGRFIGFDRASGRLTSTRDSQGREVTYAYTDGLLSSATGVDGKTEIYTYGAEDRLTKVTSPTGVAKVEVGYDGQGRVEWVDQAGEGRATIAYDSADKRTITRADGVQVVQDLDSYGRLAVERVGDVATHVIYDADGREVMRIDGIPHEPMDGYSPSAPAVIFNDRGDVIWQIDEVGRGTRTFFNTDHKPTRVRDVRGGITSYTYGTQGRLTSVTDPRDGTWEVEHNGRGQVTKVTDPVGREETRSYEADGDPEATTNHFGGQSTFTTNARGLISSRTDPQGNVSSWTYTSWGAIASQTVDGDTASTTFDDDRRPSTATDPRGKPTTYAYDTAGRLQSMTNPAGGVTDYDYDVMGRVTDVTDPLDRVTTRTYNDQGRVTRLAGPEGSSTDTEYDPSGRAVWVTDALGAVTQHVVDRSGRILRTDYPDGGSESFVYGNGADVTSYTNPVAGTFTYTYNRAGELTQTKSPLNAIETQTYDVLGRPLVTTDARGNATTLAYSNSGRTTTATDTLGAVSTVTTNTSGQVVTETDGMGSDTTYTYDGAGRVLTRTEPGGRVHTTVYDGAGNPIEETDPAGRTITAVLDDLGRPVSKTYADGSTEEFGYDAVGNLTSHTDRRGHTWTYEFDDLNRVTLETNPLAGTTVHGYDEVGNETSTTDPTGVVTTTAHDPMGRPAVVANPAGAYTEIGYDKLGNPLTVRNPAGGVTTYTYDKVGRTTKQALPVSAGTTTYGYDLNNNLTSSTRAGRSLTWVYDTRNRATQDVDRRGNATLNTYNLADQLTSVTTPSGSATSYGYNPAGRLASATNDTGQATTYTWTLDDQLASLTLPRGGGYDWTYDDAGHRATETVHTGGTGPEANPVTTFTHDPLGNLTATTYPTGRQVAATYDKLNRPATQTATPAGGGSPVARGYDYDAAGRLTAVTRTGAPALSYTYDALGRMATSTDQVGTTTFGYDAADRITSITPPTGQAASTFTYDTADRLATMRGAANLNYTFSTAGTLSSRSNSSGTTSAQVSYTYDADNHPLTITSGNAKIAATYNTDGLLATQTHTLDGLVNDEEGVTSYTYDDNQRLASATLTRDGAEVRTRGYTWDGDNNRTLATTRNGDATAPTTQTDSTYDKAGRLQSTTDPTGTTSYTYDLDGQLTGIDAPGTNADQTYTYDGFGELATTTLGSGGSAATTAFIRDGLSRLTGWNTTGTTSASATFGYTGTADATTSLTTGTSTGPGSGPSTQLVRDPTGTLLSARTTTGTTTQVSHTATNTHGDLIAWRATNATLVTGTLYDPFGQPTTAAGAGTGPGAALPFGYESHLTLPGSGLIDLGSRAYHPATGTFTSQDTVIGDLNAPVSLNRYTYAFGNPLNYTDPTGYWPKFLEDAASAVSNGVSNGIDKVTDAAQTITSHVQTAVQAVTSTVSSTASTIGSVATTAATAATRKLQGAAAWVREHKAETLSFAVGVGFGVGCTALTAGAGALGCAALSGAAAGVVGNALDPNADHSFAGYAQAAGWGAGAGALGFGAGKLLAPVAKTWTAPLKARSQALMSRSGQGINSIRNALSKRIPGLRRGGAANTGSAYRTRLPSRPAVGGGPSHAYQVQHAGPTEYQISGGGHSVWADSVADDAFAIEAKFVGNAASSPYVPGSNIPPFIRSKILAGQEDEFARYGAAIADPTNPLVGLRVVTNSQDAGGYFGGLMNRLGVPGEVLVRNKM